MSATLSQSAASKATTILETTSKMSPNTFTFGGAFLTYLTKSSVGTLGNCPKVIRTENLQPSVTSGKDLRSIGLEIRPERPLTCVRVSKYPLLKTGLRLLFWQQWTQYTLLTPFFSIPFLLCFVLFCCCCCCCFLRKKNFFISLFYFFHFSIFIFIFLIGTDGPP